jgi:hypothetical protein
MINGVQRIRIIVMMLIMELVMKEVKWDSFGDDTMPGIEDTGKLNMNDNGIKWYSLLPGIEDTWIMFFGLHIFLNCDREASE